MLNHEIDHFWDSTTGDGISHYYSITVVDVTGKRESSDFMRGLTKP